MIVLGIDPGLGGALAVLDCSPGGRPFVIAAIDVPTVGDDAKRRVWVAPLLEWIWEMPTKPEVAYIERAQAMPDQGASSGFIYGRAVGALEATILCAGITLKTAEPSVWKRRFGLTGEKDLTKRKARSRELADRNVDRAADLLARAKDHNRAEAMLIACFGAMTSGVQIRFPLPDQLPV